MGRVLLFYDGDCGLCQAAVRLVLRLDRDGAVLVAPLHGRAWRRLGMPGPGTLPETMILRLPDGTLRMRDAAVRTALGRLGTGWRLLAALAGFAPPGLGRVVYDALARHRRRFGALRRGGEGCPVPDPSWRQRHLP